ncbi:MAG: hypothetical protein J3K34DRAFT_523788 [Monoraphidium minutum]|nr:MAG: hypothetical protein J3K34DRAFT_523788 [Monoraphidium minutum]
MRTDGSSGGGSGRGAPPRRAAAPRRGPPLALAAALLLLALAALLPRAAGSGRALAAVKKASVSLELCQNTIGNCSECTFRWRNGRYVLYCKLCLPGYKVLWGQNQCYYEPECGGGTFWNSSVSTCDVCGYNYYCPPAVGDVTSRFACMPGTMTRTQYARNEFECWSKPGWGWLRPGNTVGNIVRCPRGTYNPRSIRAPLEPIPAGADPFGCKMCLGNLTTVQQGSDSLLDCVAPLGHYYELGKAEPCPSGFYKPTISNDECDMCPDGRTTPAPGAVEASSCYVVEPGYGVDANGVARSCNTSTYNAGGQTWTFGTPSPCTPCPSGSETEDEGSISIEACSNPPGWGFNNATKASAVCARGWFNPGWDRLPCTACGENIATEEPGALDSDSCVIPPGWGARQSANGEWRAFPCPVDFYGSDAPTPGLARLECLGCLEHMTTLNRTAATSDAACVTRPGYGYTSKQVRICVAGTWSYGLARDPCTPCSNGYTTETDGAVDPSQCLVATGWTPDGKGGVAPCRLGEYKSTLGDAPCSACPSGTSTLLMGSALLSDCGVCRPGWGTPAIDPAAPACKLCAPGTWGAGLGMLTCQSCGAGRVSKVGASRQEDCVLQFISNGGSSSNHFDYVPMAPESLTAVAAATTEAACAAACDAAAGGADGCQYYVFRGAWPAGSKCYNRLVGLEAPQNFRNNSRPLVVFQAKQATYAAYYGHASDWDNLGRDVGGANLLQRSLIEAQFACEAIVDCLGAKFAPGGGEEPWRLFGGDLFESTYGKVRIWGESINPWSPAT